METNEPKKGQNVEEMDVIKELLSIMGSSYGSVPTAKTVTSPR